MLGIAMVSGLLAGAVSFALGFVPQIVALLVGLCWGWLILAAGGILTEVVTTPFVAIVATLGVASEFSQASELFEVAWYGREATGEQQDERLRALADRVLSR